MKNRERTFTRTRYGWRSGELELCLRSFDQRVTVPKNVNKIVAVLSDSVPRHKSYFTIARPRVPREGLPARAGIVGLRNVWFYQTQCYLAEAYRKGFRYVWWEYEV